jgi:hypothetical protein
MEPAIVALLFVALFFAFIFGAIALVILFVKRLVSGPKPTPTQREQAILRAFTAPFEDGTASLCSALPDAMLLDHYRANLDKLARHKGDAVALSADLSEMLVIHMEIASRYATVVYNRK